MMPANYAHNVYEWRLHIQLRLLWKKEVLKVDPLKSSQVLFTFFTNTQNNTSRFDVDPTKGK